MKKRPIIKFSHTYDKLLDSYNDVITEAILLQVIEVEIADLSFAFLDYDTDSGKFKLPKTGKYIMLIFLKPYCLHEKGMNLFTTLRRYTQQKFEYYYDLIGQTFEVVSPNSE